MTMKKLITVILCAILAIHTAAMTTDGSTYEYETAESHVTVAFSETSSLSAEKKQAISDFLVSENSVVSPQSLCWLTGHNYKTESVSLITHKVTAKSPRCKRSIYSVKTCTKCDYIDETLISETLIVCCPAD